MLSPLVRQRLATYVSKHRQGPVARQPDSCSLISASR